MDRVMDRKALLRSYRERLTRAPDVGLDVDHGYRVDVINFTRRAHYPGLALPVAYPVDMPEPQLVELALLIAAIERGPHEHIETARAYGRMAWLIIYRDPARSGGWSRRWGLGRPAKVDAAFVQDFARRIPFFLKL